MEKQKDEIVKIKESIEKLKGKQEDLEVKMDKSMKEFVKKENLFKQIYICYLWLDI